MNEQASTKKRKRTPLTEKQRQEKNKQLKESRKRQKSQHQQHLLELSQKEAALTAHELRLQQQQKENQECSFLLTKKKEELNQQEQKLQEEAETWERHWTEREEQFELQKRQLLQQQVEIGKKEQVLERLYHQVLEQMSAFQENNERKEAEPEKTPERTLFEVTTEPPPLVCITIHFTLLI